MKELMPCPFCGGKPIFNYSSGGWSRTDMYFASYSGTIECNKCRMSLHHFSKMSDAVKAWNRRAKIEQKTGVDNNA